MIKASKSLLLMNLKINYRKYYLGTKLASNSARTPIISL